MKVKTHPLLLSGLIALLAGCASQQPTAPGPLDDAAGAPVAQTAEPAAIEQGSFEPATLYSLLVAELAAHRRMPGITLHNYLQEAERTGDLQVIKRATQVAIELKSRDALLQAARLWIKAEPDNPAPYRLAAMELVRRGEQDEALPMLEKMLASDDIRAVDALANRAEQMEDAERHTYLALLDQMIAKHGADPLLYYAKAALVQYDRGLEPALQLVQQALEQDPEFDRAILLEADLQSKTGHLDTALGHLREELGKRDHKQMRTLYTRLLLEKEQYPLAEQEAEQLLKRYPGDHNLYFYLGALMLEHNRLDASRAYFERLAQQVGMSSTLHYYFGRIAQLSNERTAALDHYLEVEDSNYLLASYSEIGKLLDHPEDKPQVTRIYRQARQRFIQASPMLFALEAAWLMDHQFDQDALAVFNEALTAHPDNTRLRYNRAMLGEKLGDMTLLESDLRQLIDQEPDNATALNALGYSLTDNTDRHQEALVLIKKALTLRPDDPAILDSMGWVYFNLGDYPLAMSYLERAYENFPDPEIATHLGKVYWQLGRTADALKIWREALGRDPDSQQLKDVLDAATHPSAKGI